MNKNTFISELFVTKKTEKKFDSKTEGENFFFCLMRNFDFWLERGC